MSEKLIFILKRLMLKTWVRCVLFSLVAVLAIALSMLFGTAIPEETAVKLGADSLGSLLTILATSMLTVAVFSASLMVSSFDTVSTSASPRATQLFVEDPVIQNTLATFVGTFLYSIIALVGLRASIYGGGGRLILFGFTIVILLLVVIMLLRWMNFLSVLGRMGETIDRVQKATTKAMEQRLRAPWLGGVANPAGVRGVYEIFAPTTGFVQHISMDILQKAAKASSSILHVHLQPGSFVEPTLAMISSDTLLDAEQKKKISDAVLIGSSRTFEHDPRFGMVVLSEIAARALSPAVNDPGTAQAVLAAAVKAMVYWVQHRPAIHAIPNAKFDRVTAPALPEAELLRDIFMPLSRYGAATVEVGLAIQQSLVSIARLNHAGFAGTSKELSDYATAQSVHAGIPDVDLQRLRVAAGGVAT